MLASKIWALNSKALLFPQSRSLLICSRQEKANLFLVVGLAHYHNGMVKWVENNS
jgi:hypothetical protein